VPTHGLRISEGNEADNGVFKADSWGFVVVAILKEESSLKLE
jgi:hypothetical protein